jgi:hypothetical protein
MRHYWFHLVESKSPRPDMRSTYVLSRADAPTRNGEGGATPTVHYPSWEQLARKLSRVGIDGGVLQDAKDNLDSKGSHTIQDVVLSDDQVEQLGFVDLVA